MNAPTSPTSFSLEDAAEIALAPGYRPGERMLHGAPYVYDMGLLNAHLADIRIAIAPADLSGLDWAELGDLHAAWLSADRRRPFDPDLREFGRRVCDERAGRPEHACFTRSPITQAAE